MKPVPALRVVLVASAALTATAAMAARPVAPAMSCHALTNMVERNGAVVLSTSRTTYDRYVADRRYCERTEITKPAWIVSSDNDECFIGYTCKEYVRDDFY
jgi:hypothetical protein